MHVTWSHPQRTCSLRSVLQPGTLHFWQAPGWFWGRRILEAHFANSWFIPGSQEWLGPYCPLVWGCIVVSSVARQRSGPSFWCMNTASIPGPSTSRAVPVGSCGLWRCMIFQGVHVCPCRYMYARCIYLYVSLHVGGMYAHRHAARAKCQLVSPWCSQAHLRLHVSCTA